jgi:hypothetical protein
MLRSIGIPARLVVGYSQGERVSEKNEFRVRIKDSHSWVEAFFPGSGWIILEPTPSQPEIVLNKIIETPNTDEIGRYEYQTLKEAAQIQNPELNLFSSINEKYGITNNNIQIKPSSTENSLAVWIISFGLLVLLILSLIYGRLLRRKPILLPLAIEKKLFEKGKNIPNWLKTWADYEKLPGFEKAYQNIRLLSNLLLFRMEKYPTPKEFFEKFGAFMKDNNQFLLIFMNEYQRLTYSPLNDGSEDSYYKNYIQILGMILKSWRDKRIAEIKFRTRRIKPH